MQIIKKFIYLFSRNQGIITICWNNKCVPICGTNYVAPFAALIVSTNFLYFGIKFSA